MKICNFFVLLPLLQISFFAKAGETNELYVTDNDQNGYYAGHSVIEHENQLLEAAKKTRESLPSKDFPEGNWGEIVDGFQLSLRFDKQTYTNGEPITAILLIRNTAISVRDMTNQSFIVGYPNDYYQNKDGPFFLLVTNGAGNVMPAQEAERNRNPAGGLATAMPHAQHKYLERLNNRYNLTNGTYLIHASGTILRFISANGDPLKREWDEVKSAEVKIKIEDSPPK